MVVAVEQVLREEYGQRHRQRDAGDQDGSHQLRREPSGLPREEQQEEDDPEADPQGLQLRSDGVLLIPLVHEGVGHPALVEKAEEAKKYKEHEGKHARVNAVGYEAGKAEETEDAQKAELWIEFGGYMGHGLPASSDNDGASVLTVAAAAVAAIAIVAIIEPT